MAVIVRTRVVPKNDAGGADANASWFFPPMLTEVLSNVKFIQPAF